MGTTWCENNLPRIFMDHRERTWHLEIAECSSSHTTLALDNPISRSTSLLKRKDNSSRGSCWRLRVHLCYHTIPTPASGILTWFPFELRANGALNKDFPYVLGSSNPWPIAVLMETFSTSVFKVLIWIIATTTKICTRRRSTQAHARGFATTLTPSYSLQPQSCYNGRVSVVTLQRHPFSGLVHSAGELLHTP